MINVTVNGHALHIKPDDLWVEIGNDSITVRASDNVVLFAGYDLPPDTHGDYVAWAEWDGCVFQSDADRRAFTNAVRLNVEVLG